MARYRGHRLTSTMVEVAYAPPIFATRSHIAVPPLRTDACHDFPNTTPSFRPSHRDGRRIDPRRGRACGLQRRHAEEAGAPPPPQVSAAPVLVKQVSQWDEFSGRVEAVQSVELRPRVSGYIDKVNYVEGQEVKKGEVLFTIDARSYQAEYDRAAAELARPHQATLARSESERAKRLSEQQAISTETAEQRRAAADQSGAAVRRAGGAGCSPPQPGVHQGACTDRWPCRPRDGHRWQPGHATAPAC